MVLEKTVESPLDCKEIQPVHSEGDQSWVFIGRTDAEAETPILWPRRAGSFEKTLMLGKIESRRRSLAKFIPRYLILFVAVVNGIDSLISLCDFSLLDSI